MNLEKIYKDIINKLFTTLIEEKRRKLITLILNNHENNIDEYDSGNVSTKFIIDNINIISITDLLNL